MSKQQYRRVLESLCSFSHDEEKVRMLNRLVPMVTDPILARKLKAYISQLNQCSKEDNSLQLRLQGEILSGIRSDLEEYLLLNIQEKKPEWQYVAEENGWGPVQELKDEIKSLKALLKTSNDIRKEFQKGRFELLKQGGEIQKATLDFLPKDSMKMDLECKKVFIK